MLKALGGHCCLRYLGRWSCLGKWKFWLLKAYLPWDIYFIFINNNYMLWRQTFFRILALPFLSRANLGWREFLFYPLSTKPLFWCYRSTPQTLRWIVACHTFIGVYSHESLIWGSKGRKIGHREKLNCEAVVTGPQPVPLGTWELEQLIRVVQSWGQGASFYILAYPLDMDSLWEAV